MQTNSQWGAVRPSGFRKKPRHLDAMRAQHGTATQQVVATKQRQQQDEETKFNQDMQSKSLALQQEQHKDAKKNMKRQEQMGYANTGMNLLQTIMSFF